MEQVLYLLCGLIALPRFKSSTFGYDLVQIDIGVFSLQNRMHAAEWFWIFARQQKVQCSPERINVRLNIDDASILLGRHIRRFACHNRSNSLVRLASDCKINE